MNKILFVLGFVLCACGSDSNDQEMSMENCHLPVEGNLYTFTIKSDDCNFEETSSVVVGSPSGDCDIISRYETECTRTMHLICYNPNSESNLKMTCGTDAKYCTSVGTMTINGSYCNVTAEYNLQ